MTFDHLFLLGLPASGKSEFIDFMKKQPLEELMERYHIGHFEEVDDFVWLWEKFIEDDVWEHLGKKRLFSWRCGNNNENYAHDGQLFDFMIERFNQEIPRKYLARPQFYDQGTLFIEFSRGGAHTYGEALNRFDPAILRRSAILYIHVTPQESRRRNEARYREKLAHSILAHKTPDEIMEKFYPYDDWSALTDNQPHGTLQLNGIDVPFVTMNNEPESTDPEVLSVRYGNAIKALWRIKSSG